MFSLKPKSVFPYLIRDVLTFGFAFFISFYIFRDSNFLKYEWAILICLMFFLFLFELWRKPNNPNWNHGFLQRFFNHLKAYFVFILLVLLCYYLVPIQWHHGGRFIAILTALCMLGFTINYLLVEFINRIRYTNERLKSILVAGTGITAKNVERQLMQQRAGFQLKGFINCNNSEECAVGTDRVLGDLDNIDQYLYNNTVDEIVIALPTIYTKEIQNVLTVADYHGVRVKYILDYHEIFGNNYKITRYGQIDAVDIRKLPADGMLASVTKNCFDLIFSSIALLLMSPILIIIAILIKLESPGPVFYSPVRIGRGGKPFKVYKFRSMSVNDDASGGTMSTQKNDPRVTKVGRVLRKYSLDELPQFFNVFLGDMSVVGPRPHRRFLNRHLQETVYKYMIRHYVKPGITGWAQVNGWRGPTDTEEQKRQRTIHDLWYIENWSFWLDFKIIFLTIFGNKVHKSAF